MGRVKIFIAQSLDGFIGGENDDISWLPHPQDDDCGWEDFISRIGCVLMGRKTYDIITQMGIEWPHSSRETLLATTRELPSPPPRVTSAGGDIVNLVTQAKDLACGRDVYIDGGMVIRQAMDADVVDDICVSVVPIILGRGTSLFAGCQKRHKLQLVKQRQLPMGMHQLSYIVEQRNVMSD